MRFLLVIILFYCFSYYSSFGQSLDSLNHESILVLKKSKFKYQGKIYHDLLKLESFILPNQDTLVPKFLKYKKTTKNSRVLSFIGGAFFGWATAEYLFNDKTSYETLIPGAIVTGYAYQLFNKSSRQAKNIIDTHNRSLQNHDPIDDK
jgi:dsRNA-specific ribonuclease